jgi:uncharacterized protein (TIGR03437 family)
MSDTGCEMTPHRPYSVKSPSSGWFIPLQIALLTAMAACPVFGQAPSINPAGVVDAASFAPGRPVSAGNVVAIFGSNLATQIATADTVPWSFTLSNVSVTFNGITAPLQFVAPGQINAQIPWEVLPAGTSGTVNAVVTSQGVPSAPQPVVVNLFGPGVYTYNNHAIAINITDPTSQRYGAFAAPTGTVGTYPAFPAQVNDVLFVYAGGLGAVSAAPPDGAAATTTVTTNTTPTVLVNNVPAAVSFSGLAPVYPGVYQINLQVPQVASGNALPFQIQIGGITSTSAANIAVQ